MFKIKLKTQELIREDLPQFLVGLDKASLVDLSWVDEALELKGYGYFEEVDTSITPSNLDIYDGKEILHVDMDLKVVEVSRSIRAKTEAELTADRKAKVPKEVTKTQAMKALKEIGKWEAFKGAIASNEDAQEEWMLTSVLVRANPFVESLAPALGLSDAQIDELFILAGTK